MSPGNKLEQLFLKAKSGPRDAGGYPTVASHRHHLYARRLWSGKRCSMKPLGIIQATTSMPGSVKPCSVDGASPGGPDCVAGSVRAPGGREE